MTDPVVAPVTPPVVPPVIAPVTPAVVPPVVVAPSDPATILSGDDPPPAGDPPAIKPAAEGDWATDWREKMSGGNEKALNILKRFSSPQTVANALLADRQRMSDGKLRAVLADDATPEQIAQYRKANGIPEKAEAYLEKLPDGLVIGESDKAGFVLLAERMHGLNALPAVVHEAVKVYNDIKALESERWADENDRIAQESRDALVSEYGSEFKGNMNAVSNLLAGMPEEARKLFEGARGSDGFMLLAQAPVFKWLVQTARDINPAGTVVSSATGDIGKAVGSEIEQIEKVMKGDLDTYRKDKKMQARYTELLEARGRMTSSGRAA